MALIEGEGENVMRQNSVIETPGAMRLGSGSRKRKQWDKTGNSTSSIFDHIV
jgi:hypothetical protein